jgi:hypothetical protein
MAILDDLRQAGAQAISAAASSTRAQGTALRADFENLVRPNLDSILAEIAAITEDAIAGNIDTEQAQDDLKAQTDRVRTLILTIAELTLLAVQSIINAVIEAVRTVVNTASTHAVGFGLL